MTRESFAAGSARRGRLQPPVDLLLEREAHAHRLDVGPWSASLRGAEIDDISFDGVLVVRSIRLVARDEDWGTLPMQVDTSNGVPQAGGQSTITLRGRAGEDGSSCAWTLTLSFDGNILRADARVEATRTFRRNRLGLIVLHPPELAGSPLTVTHPDGSRTSTMFPEHISPHQPAADIHALSWRTPAERGAVDTSLGFSGEIFEMEDQRNWTDASFKTYSTPLSKPFPVELSPGTVVEQSVELHCVATDVEDAAAQPNGTNEPTRAVVTFGAPDAASRLPIVTTSVSSGAAAGPPVLPTFGPLLCEVDPGHVEWPAILDRAVQESGGRPLDLRVSVETSSSVAPVLDRVRNAGIPLATVGVFDRSTHVSTPELLADVRRQLDEREIAAELVGGTRAHFTELNRNSAGLEAWDGPLSFSITPFMHDRGGHQLVESIAMQRLVAHEALDIARGRPLHIGPITLGARFNAVATSAAHAPLSEDISDGFGAELVDGATDARQTATSLGAWVLASVAALALPGVRSLSYFEAFGERGLRNTRGEKTTAGEVLERIASLSGGAVARLTTDHPAIVGLAVASSGNAPMDSVLIGMVGNLGDAPLTVGIPGAVEFVLAPGAVREVTVPLS